MSVITTTEFRSNLSDYLAEIKKWHLIFLWRRKKKEFVVLPIELFDEEDVEMLQSRNLSDTVEKRRKEKTVSFEDAESLLLGWE